jgi:hypothetical protein
MDDLNKFDAVYISMIIDRSGSMSSVGKSLIDGTNNFINEQRNLSINNKLPTFLNLTIFDNVKETIYDFNNILEVDPISEQILYPRNTTRLVDTAAEEIEKLEIITHNSDYTKCNSIFAILTDGFDNCSVKYTSEDLNKLILNAKKQGTTCIFLGANQDAIQMGNKFGFSKEYSMEYDANEVNTSNAFHSLSREISRSSSGTKSTGFTLEQRQSSKTTIESIDKLKLCRQ